MTVILYMATTANGFIAKEDDDTSWISTEEWSSYSAMVQKVGCMIIGHRTYEIITKQPEFAELQNVNVVIVSTHDVKVLAENHVAAHSPREALELLKDFKEVIVAGGGMLNAAFMKEGLIDELYIDIEPTIFGNGIPLFAEADFDCQLQLLGTTKLNENEVQLHYRVLR